jgi:fumarylacetoacetase
VTLSRDPIGRSWVDVPAGSHFPLENLPFGVFRPRAGAAPRVGVAIGDSVLDVAVIEEAGLLAETALAGRRLFARRSLNALLAAGRPAWRAARASVARLLSADEPALRDRDALRDAALLPAAHVEMLLPAEVGDYTDFYSSREHATNVGTMFRGPANALQPNWLHLPVAYHGRASSLVISGADVRRPCGQVRLDEGAPPVLVATRQLDFELEIGALIGPGNALGEPIDVAAADEHVFGMVLVNDWSARDIQRWEYVPLGPFLGKNFATSISPWVVTMDALEPFRCAGPTQDPPPLPYLRSEGLRTHDIHLEVWLQTPRMTAPHRLCASNTRHLYWDLRQQLAHHTVNGCNLRPGDLLASGTISGPEPGSRGSLLELTWRGEAPLELPSGESRTFLEDGDRVVMTGWCEGGGVRIGFGEVAATIGPARHPSS